MKTKLSELPMKIRSDFSTVTILLLTTRLFGLHFCHRQYGLPSITFA